MFLFQNTIIRSAIGGALGGFLGWMISEPVRMAHPRMLRDLAQILLWDAIWAAPIGVLLGADGDYGSGRLQ